MCNSAENDLEFGDCGPGSQKRRTRAATRPNRAGAVLVLLVLLLTLVLAMVVFAVDIGRMTALRAEMQNGVDAGTLAAQLQLRSKPDDIAAEKRAAEKFVRINQIGSKLIPKKSIQVEAGFWDSEKRTFDASGKRGRLV